MKILNKPTDYIDVTPKGYVDEQIEQSSKELTTQLTKYISKQITLDNVVKTDSEVTYTLEVDELSPISLLSIQCYIGQLNKIPGMPFVPIDGSGLDYTSITDEYKYTLEQVIPDKVAITGSHNVDTKTYNKDSDGNSKKEISYYGNSTISITLNYKDIEDYEHSGNIGELNVLYIIATYRNKEVES